MNTFNTMDSEHDFNYSLDVIIATIKEYHIKLSFEDCAFLIKYEQELNDELDCINKNYDLDNMDSSDYSFELLNIKKQTCESELAKITEIKALMCGGVNGITG